MTTTIDSPAFSAARFTDTDLLIYNPTPVIDLHTEYGALNVVLNRLLTNAANVNFPRPNGDMTEYQHPNAECRPYLSTRPDNVRWELRNVLTRDEEQFRMSTWISGDAKYETSNNITCGTVGCIAGWTVMDIYGVQIARMLDNVNVSALSALAQQQLGLPDDRLFVRSLWPYALDRFGDRDGIINLLALLHQGRLGVITIGEDDDEWEKLTIVERPWRQLARPDQPSPFQVVGAGIVTVDEQQPESD